jgi:hypothetical protein
MEVPRTYLGRWRRAQTPTRTHTFTRVDIIDRGTWAHLDDLRHLGHVALSPAGAGGLQMKDDRWIDTSCVSQESAQLF